MNKPQIGALHAYSIKLALSSGRRITLPQNLLTRTQAESIAEELDTIARESGLEITQCEVSPVTRDERDQVLDLARSTFKEEEYRAALPKSQTAVKCRLCQCLIPMDEALSSSPPADVFLSGDPIAGDSRCDMCPRHSVENCHECRAEWLLSNSQSAFICCVCRQRLRSEVA
jgi:hypothetical protein